jgi:hypothetical protein
MHASERQFADFLTAHGKTWKAQPCRFKLGDTTYTPDFYCPEDDLYYEVKRACSSREIEKVIRFKSTYPKIKLKVVSPDGNPYYSPGSGQYISALEYALSILKSKDITEISENELGDLVKLSPRIYGFHQPSFKNESALIKTVRKANLHVGIHGETK